MRFFPPFRTGDVVKYVGKDRIWRNCSTLIHIINEVSVEGVNKYEYSTNIGAWIHHFDFELVEECSAKSIAKLLDTKDDDDEY